MQYLSSGFFIISIHAPRTGSDKFRVIGVHTKTEFQSTLPARGATFTSVTSSPYRFISIHAPRTGSDRMVFWPSGHAEISIHAPRTGSDYIIVATPILQTISIHAPRTGSDLMEYIDSNIYCDFNPRSPHGERPAILQPHTSRSHFNPRSPHGERPYKSCGR